MAFEFGAQEVDAMEQDFLSADIVLNQSIINEGGSQLTAKIEDPGMVQATKFTIS